jgi:sirohydrochlorin ferrochelatase
VNNPGLLIAIHPNVVDPTRDAYYAECILAHQYPVPARVVFIEREGGLREPVDALRAAGVDSIVLVPLYPTLANAEIGGFLHRLGLGPAPKDSQEYELVDAGVPVALTDSFGPHPLLAEILLQRGLEMAKEPSREALLLAVHGEMRGAPPTTEGTIKLAGIVDLLRERGAFAEVVSGHMHPHNSITEGSQSLADRYAAVNVVPYFAGASSFVHKVIPSHIRKADRQNIRYTGKTLLEHPLLGDYINARFQEAVEGRTVDLASRA